MLQSYRHSSSLPSELHSIPGQRVPPAATLAGHSHDQTGQGHGRPTEHPGRGRDRLRQLRVPVCRTEHAQHLRQGTFRPGLRRSAERVDDEVCRVCAGQGQAQGPVGGERARPVPLTWRGHGAQAEDTRDEVRLLLLHGEDKHSAARSAPAENENLLLLLEVGDGPLPAIHQ